MDTPICLPCSVADPCTLPTPFDSEPVIPQEAQVLEAGRVMLVGDDGGLFRSDLATGINVTIPATAPEGLCFQVAQWGAGVVTIVAGAGATNRSAVTATPGQYKVLDILVVKNPTGLAAEFVVGIYA